MDNSVVGGFVFVFVDLDYENDYFFMLCDNFCVFCDGDGFGIFEKVVCVCYNDRVGGGKDNFFKWDSFVEEFGIG